MYSVQHIRESHEHVNLRGVNGNIDGETKKKVVKPLVDHVNNVKKGVESGRCIGVGMGRKR